MCTVSLTLAKPGKAMPGPYSSLMVFRRGMRPGTRERGAVPVAVPDGRSGEKNSGQRRQLVVFTPGRRDRVLTNLHITGLVLYDMKPQGKHIRATAGARSRT